MPPTHLTRVDLPAPLSPTSAMTSPGNTLKSTLCSTWIAPKLLLIPRKARMGESATMCPSDEYAGRLDVAKIDRRIRLREGSASILWLSQVKPREDTKQTRTGGVAGMTGHATGRTPGADLRSRDPSLGAECDERAGAD